jgi:hypothetical protein
LLAGHHVAVDVESERHGGVTEAFVDNLRVEGIEALRGLNERL